jgi:8-oxo-dGTP diphosphatase
MGDNSRVVTAAVVIENGRLLLTRRPPGDKLAGLWELPGGKVEAGESPQECLKRELLEELAMRAGIGEVLARTTYEYDHGCFSMIALRATRLSEFKLLAHDAFAWVGADELKGYDLAPADVELVDCLIKRGHWT